jgi:hypothetical protein
MKRLIHLAVPLLATTLAGAATAGADDVRACDFEVKARCASGDARVTLADGALKRLEVNVIWCGGSGGPAYTCSIDSARKDGDSQWSDDKGATLITNAAPFSPAQPDRIKVTVGRSVSIDFGETQSLGRCGAGAELPRAIVIPETKGPCRVWLAPPE